MKTKFYFLFISILFLTLFSKANAATFIVDRADDVAGATACDPVVPNDCSLRGAIINANANGAGLDIIQFNIGGGNAQTITMSSTPLPDIQTSLIIDGTTQPLFGGLPLIEINGAASVINTNGFRISSPLGNIPITVTIKSLIINRFKGSGIYFTASSGITATVTGCYIGTNPGGSIDLGNGNHGIRISAFPDSSFTIGGTLTSERNVISGNEDDGINVVSAFDLITPGNTSVLVLNNFIGTTSAGNADLGNSGDGISFGGPGFGYSLQVGNGLGNGRNIISGNDQSGIAATSGTVSIVGNYIGTSLNGNADVGNTLDGIQLAGEVSNATIGGTVLGIPVGNVISGNNRMGIWINDASIPATIRTNKIGMNAAGTAALGNSSGGIFLFENDTFTNSEIIIGSDTNASDGNVISGNGGDGIEISEKVRQVKMYANKIGTNEAGTLLFPNTLVGIRIASAQNEVGVAGNNIASNIISGNNSGIFLIGVNAGGNQIFNNFIGTNSSGANLGNTGAGIYINQGALGNQIGSAAAGGGNVIAFNGGSGVNVAEGTLNAIRANSIYSNDGLGIDLNADGVTANDPGDNDSGPNSLQNFPVIQRATPTRITGFLDSLGDQSYAIDFYRVDACDASGFGEGRFFLGSQTILTNPVTGIGEISFPTTLIVGQIITATATRTVSAAGDTSEFSQCLTVTGEPGNLSFSAANYTVNENSGFRTIVVNRNGGSTGTITVNYATSDGTATAGQDYTAQSGTFTFFSGEVVKSFDIPINDDLFDETDETINLTLSNPPPGVFLTPNANAVLTILDNDDPPTISITDVTHAEGNLGDATQFSFRIQLSAPSQLPISIDYATANGTATGGVDFIHTNGTVNFAAFETLKNILVTVNGDIIPELDETFFVNLSNPVNAVFGDNQAVGTILDDDNPGKFSFSFAPYSGTEHDTVEITVSRTSGTAGTVSVDYATGGGTALPFIDYTPASGTLVFGDGETTKTFNVVLLDDLIPEPAEYVNLILSNPLGGATLGVPSVAVLNIIDDDNGTLLNLAGEVVSSADHSPIPNVTMTLQGAQNATTTTDANGRYSFSNLAPNSNYTVTPSALGYTFNPISQQFTNLTNDDLNVNFNATAAPVRQMRIIGGNATPGQNISATVELVAQGDENSLGFSLNYDPAILSNPNVVLNQDAASASLTVNASQSGKLAILLGLPAGQAFTAGTKSLLTITFNTAPTSAFNSPLTFGDVPLARGIANTNSDALTAIYLDGAVTFAQGFEADVAPRPTGNNNGTISISDVTQVGLFVVGLNTVDAEFNEFQRADCAPRISLGDGQLTVADYTQAGRYAAGLDTVNPAGGAAIQSLLEFDSDGKLAFPLSPFNSKSDSKNKNLVPTVVRVVNVQSSPGQQVFVSIEADAQGTENGFGFTLDYDASKLSNPLVQKGTATQTASLIPNTTQIGKVGVILAMPFGEAVSAGTRQIVTIRFDVAADAPAGNTPLTFNDTPVIREVSDVDAGVLQSAFEDGNVDVLGPSSANISISGKVLTKSGRGIARAMISITDSGGETRTTLTNPFGNYRFAGLDSGEIYTLTIRHKQFQFTPSTQILTVFEDAPGINFIATSEN